MTEIRILLVVVFIAVVGTILASNQNNTFFSNFWPNFFSDLFVGILVGGFISWALARSKRYDAQVTVDVSNTEKSDTRLQFSLKNIGQETFGSDEVYWHIFVDGDTEIIKLTYFGEKPGQLDTNLFNKRFHHFRDLLKKPTFPGRSTDLFYVTVRNINNNKINMYYILSTAHGMLPKNAKIDKNGDFNPSTFGKIKINTSK